MKVVLFCGGLGTRLRDYSESVPKPMVPVGYRPVLWHVMKYYAHHGHKDFILALGYKSDVIKDFFLNYSEAASNDFVLSRGGKQVDLLNTDIEDWTITFVDTGATSNVGERLRRVKPYVENEEMFMANYSDGLTDVPLNGRVEAFKKRGKVASFLAVHPPGSYHVMRLEEDGLVKAVEPIGATGAWINAGYFIFTPAVFDYMKSGEELLEEPFGRLVKAGELFADPYTGFWQPMDTFKEKQHLDELYNSDAAPWVLWDSKNGK